MCLRPVAVPPSISLMHATYIITIDSAEHVMLCTKTEMHKMTGFVGLHYFEVLIHGARM